MTADKIIESATAALAPHGLILRGGFDFHPGEDAPPGPSRTAGAILLVGQAGFAAWPHFRAWLAGQPKAPPDPLDAWSREVVEKAASAVGARAAFPFDKPYLPFQRWAMRAEGLKPSPLGILMHPEYGLWHAYRGALLFDRPLGLTPHSPPAHLCDSCVEKPCLHACPVKAYSVSGFAYQPCLGHVRSPAGKACRATGCLARNACPFGRAYRYPADMQAFHMAAFAGAR